MAVVAQSNADLPRLGILLMLVAWLLFSVVDTGATWLAVAGIPAFQLAFMRYAGHFVISIGVIAKAALTRTGSKRITCGRLSVVRCCWSRPRF